MVAYWLDSEGGPTLLGCGTPDDATNVDLWASRGIGVIRTTGCCRAGHAVVCIREVMADDDGNALRTGVLVEAMERAMENRRAHGDDVRHLERLASPVTIRTGQKTKLDWGPDRPGIPHDLRTLPALDDDW